MTNISVGLNYYAFQAKAAFSVYWSFIHVFLVTSVSCGTLLYSIFFHTVIFLGVQAVLQNRVI